MIFTYFDRKKWTKDHALSIFFMVSRNWKGRLSLQYGVAKSWAQLSN